MSSPPTSVDALSQAVTELQSQLSEAHSQINAHQSQLSAAAQKVGSLEQELNISRTQATAIVTGTKKNKPNPFNGRGSITRWCVQMDNYIAGCHGIMGMNITLSFLVEHAHEWWIVYSHTEDGRMVQFWEGLRNALTMRFETLNKEKIARDKLARWRQVKDVATFNDDFNKILL